MLESCYRGYIATSMLNATHCLNGVVLEEDQFHEGLGDQR